MGNFISIFDIHRRKTSPKKIQLSDFTKGILGHHLALLIIANLQLNSQLHLHSKSIQLFQELSWSYAQ